LVLIRTSVTVKAVVTEEWRRRLAAEAQETLRRVDSELEKLSFQLKRVLAEGEKTPSAELAALAEKLEEDRGKRQELRSQLLERLKQVARLQPGDLVVQGNTEGLVAVRPGDRWEQVVNTEIVVKDGVVVAVTAGGTERCE